MRAGFPAFHSLTGNVAFTSVPGSPAEYLVRSGAERNAGDFFRAGEVSHKESSNPKGFTPFDLLRAIDDGSPKSALYASLFRDYAKAFFGARQCFWSKGLKALFGIDDLSDEQLAEFQEDDAKEVCSITSDQWRLVLEQKRMFGLLFYVWPRRVDLLLLSCSLIRSLFQ